MAMNATWANRDDDRNAKRAADAAQSGQVLFAWYAQGFSDALGDRLLLFDNTSGAPLELLRLRPELSRAAGFESRVRQLAAELRDFDDAHHCRVLRVDRLPDPGGGLAIVSAGTQGQRLSDVLRLAEQRHVQPTGEVVRQLVPQLVGAVAKLHGRGERVAHGALNLERLVVTPDGGLLVTEYVFGSALALLPLTRSAMWRTMHLALPMDAGVQPFDRRTDVLQTGIIALALVLGRPLGEDDYPGRLIELVSEADDRLLLGGWGKLAPPFRRWLLRMLQIDLEPAIADGIEAHYALQEVLALDARARFGAGAVEAFVRACNRRQGARQGGDLSPAPDEETPRALPAASDDEPDEFNPFAKRADGVDTAAEPPVKAGARSRQPTLLALTAADGAPPTAAADSRWRQTALIVLTIVAVAQAVFIGARLISGSRTATPSSAIATVDSSPGQATVLIDGKRAGVTPLRLELRPGRHVLDIAAGDRRRTIAMTATAGMTTSHYVELPAAPVQHGTLRVVTGPAGGRVLVDGQARGVSPVLVTDLAPGTHDVVVESKDGRVHQTVDVEQNATASLFVPLPGGGAPAPGWLSVAAPLDLSVYENGELLGTSRSSRIMLPAGRHQLQLTADAVSFRTTREVQVPVGRTVTLEVIVPNARLDINASPWAEVLIDNRRIGETPLSGVPVPIGRHIVTFRHPELGERTAEYLITLQGPTRISVDLRK